MSYSLDFELAQKHQMSLTPKMLQELKVLQMSNIELSQYINNALVENPALEDEAPEDMVDNLLNSQIEPEDNDFSVSEADQKQGKDFTEYTAAALSLQQYLLLQIGEYKIDLQIRKLSEYIINLINDEGYFCGSIAEISSHLKIAPHKVKKAFKLVQNLEPAGIGARNLKECILLQLKRKKLLNEITRKLVLEYLEMLGTRKYGEIAKKLDITKERVIKLHEIIRQLDPKPGLRYSSQSAEYIDPELIVKELDGRYITMFYDDKVPTLKISKSFMDLIKSGNCSSDTNKYIKEKVSKAIEVIRAVEQRKTTVLSTADFIVQYQQEFLRKGSSCLKPMTMKMAAERLGIHESTVSRTVNNKFIQTPRGIFELRYFFSSGLQKNDQGNISSQSAKDSIRKIIINEDKNNPLSDKNVRKILSDEGINISRRTVAKYRDELSILPAVMRRIKN